MERSGGPEVAPSVDSIVPDDPDARAQFERTYFAAPEHLVPTEANIKVLAELVGKKVARKAEVARALRKERNDPTIVYAGNAYTFGFSGDTMRATPPTDKDGIHKLFYEYMKQQLGVDQLDVRIPLFLPMDKIAKTMGVDVREIVPDYDQIFSPIKRDPNLASVYRVLDQKQ